MKRELRQVVKILKEVTDEHKWEFKTYSDDWIIEISNGHKTGFIYGYKFPNRLRLLYIVWERTRKLYEGII